MIITTKRKVQLAALASRVVISLRSLGGGGRVVRARRGGLWWELDLNEGIDFSIYLLGAFERSTAAALCKLLRPGDFALDIGANVGAHTLGMAKAVGDSGRVFAFEPTDFAFSKLQRNLSLNPQLVGRTRATQTFLGAGQAQTVPAGVYAKWPLCNGERIHPKHRGEMATTLRAEHSTLDEFVSREAISRMDLIKIDVDGNELPVLKGASNSLQRYKPTLVMEMSPYMHAEQNQSFVELVQLLADLNYSLTDIDSGRPVPRVAAELEQLIPDGAGINVIARIIGG
jgi:FkbM family methyltransferase